MEGEQLWVAHHPHAGLAELCTRGVDGVMVGKGVRG